MSQNPPETDFRFVFAPNQSSYTVKETTEAWRRTVLDGGEGYYNTDVLFSSKEVNCTWQGQYVIFNYVCAWYRVFSQTMQPFKIDLLIDEAWLMGVTARFIPKTLQVNGPDGVGRYTIQARLEIIPPEYDLDDDREYIDIINEFGPEYLYWLDLLQIIVNEDWPKALLFGVNWWER